MRKLMLTAAIIAIPVAVAAQAPTVTSAFMDANHMMMMMMDMVKPTGDADKDFAAMMIPHHQGAIDMAQVELQHGKDPALHKLARDIIAAQRKEIAFMRQWQAKHAK